MDNEPSTRIDSQLGNNDHYNNSNKDDVSAQQAMQKPCGCGKMEDMPSEGANPSYIYALGRIEVRQPNLSVQKEYQQVTGRTETAGQTDHEAIRSVLSSRGNRYLVREMCWVLTIEGVETYILKPRDPVDFDLLVESLRNAPNRNDLDLVIGVKGPISSPQMCNGLIVPIVVFDQIYSFNRDELIKSIPKPENIPTKKFAETAAELLDRIMQMADNVGATDEHRALNYLAVRYSPIYANAAEMHGRDFSLTSIEVRHSRLSGVRKIVDVIFSYTNRNTAVVEKYFVRIDVEKYPSLVSPLSLYYDRY